MFTNTSATVWDVALLRLSHAVTLIPRRVEMISMATFLQDFRGSDHCWIGGWGSTTPDRKLIHLIKNNSPILLKIQYYQDSIFFFILDKM